MTYTKGDRVRATRKQALEGTVESTRSEGVYFRDDRGVMRFTDFNEYDIEKVKPKPQAGDVVMTSYGPRVRGKDGQWRDGNGMVQAGHDSAYTHAGNAETLGARFLVLGGKVVA